MRTTFKTVMVMMLLFAWTASSVQAQEKYIGRKWYGIEYFMSVATMAGSETLMHMNTGNAPLTEISTFGIAGFALTSGDVLSCLLPEVSEADNRYTRGFRIAFTSISTGADGGVDWLLSMEEKGPLAALEAATVALADDITFAADSSAVQYGLRWTAIDTISSAALNTYNTSTLRELMIELDDPGDASAGEIHFLGVEEVYVKRDVFDLWRESRRDSLWIPAPTIGGVGKGNVLRRAY